jgi:hypothetical protein
VCAYSAVKPSVGFPPFFISHSPKILGLQYTGLRHSERKARRVFLPFHSSSLPKPNATPNVRAPTQVRTRGRGEKKRGVGRLGRCGQRAILKLPVHAMDKYTLTLPPCLAGVPSASRKTSRKTPVSSPEISRCEHVSSTGSNSQIGATNATPRHDGPDCPTRPLSPTGSADSRNSRSRGGGDSSGSGRRAQGMLFKPPAAKMPTSASKEFPQYCSLGIGLNMDLHDTAIGGQTGAHAWITGDL